MCAYKVASDGMCVSLMKSDGERVCYLCLCYCVCERERVCVCVCVRVLISRWGMVWLAAIC